MRVCSVDQQHGLLGDYNFSGIKVSGRLSSCVVDVVDRGGVVFT